MAQDQDGDNDIGTPGKSPARGFAALDPEHRREIARQGGRAAHALGRAHEFTPEEARSARAKRALATLVRPEVVIAVESSAAVP